MTETSTLRLIDFHSHHVPRRYELTTTRSGDEAARRRWTHINQRIADEAALVEAIEQGDIDGRVVNIPTALFARPGEIFGADLYREVNDEIAALVARHRGLAGLASVDAFSGEVSAREVERAKTLGLGGLFVESARGDLLLDAPEAFPTLAAAAAAGLPVFVHPINPPYLLAQLGGHGRVGTLFARGTVNAAALIALIEGGVLARLPDLAVVVTTLAFGGLFLSAAFATGERDETTRLLRRHVYVDTMGLHPTLIRASVDLLGADNVLMGTDWPIVSDGPIRARVERALTEAGLSAAEQRAVAGDNARRLFHGDRP